LDQAQKDNAAQLAEDIIANGEPHKDSETRILRLAGRSMGTSSQAFRELLDDMTAKVTKSKNPVDIERHKHCLNHIMNTLALCGFRFDWLALPTNPPNFANGEYLRGLGFSRVRMQRCIDTLVGNGIMFLGRKGHQGGKEAPAKASQYYPTEQFIRMMCDSLYTEFGDFDANADDDLYRFTNFNEEDMPVYESYQYKIDILRRYNAFMRDHSWAMKNPSHISIKDFDGRSGRVSNYYQGLAERRVKIRTKTLLDGYPIVEPDFSANHLRMASFLVGEELPDDPYTAIGDETGLEREQIKSVVTKCMGASSLRPKGRLIGKAHLAKIPLSADEFRVTLSSLEHHYPWTSDIFFHDVGTRLQYLEGEIALNMMEWAVNEEVPLLAVHDAYAVRDIDGQATYDHMHYIWNTVLNQAKIEGFLDNTEYTVPLVLERKKAKKAK